MERLTIVLPEKFNFTTEFPVLIKDINSGNHVGNDAFVRYINEAFWRFSDAFDIRKDNHGRSGHPIQIRSVLRRRFEVRSSSEYSYKA